MAVKHQEAANDHYHANDGADHPIPSTHGSTRVANATLFFRDRPEIDYMKRPDFVTLLGCPAAT
jgi:hypothetical protein